MIVSLLTDYGRDDDFVGVCHAVILGICPEARIVDLTHGIARHDVRQGALVLRNTLPFMPVGVHVAVVDPQVGTERRAVALSTEDGRLLVGPDNGLLCLAWERFGGVVDAVDDHALAAPARAGVGHLPRTRSVRAGGRPPRGRRAAGRGGRAGGPGPARDDRAARRRASRRTPSWPTCWRSTASATPRSTSATRTWPAPASCWAASVELRGGRASATSPTSRRRSPTSGAATSLVYEDSYRTLADRHQPRRRRGHAAPRARRRGADAPR